MPMLCTAQFTLITINQSLLKTPKNAYICSEQISVSRHATLNSSQETDMKAKHIWDQSRRLTWLALVRDRSSSSMTSLNRVGW